MENVQRNKLKLYKTEQNVITMTEKLWCKGRLMWISNVCKNKIHRHQRVRLSAYLSQQVVWVIPDERSFRLFPGLVLLSSFSWVSLSSKLWFWSFWRDRTALSWAKPAVLLTLSLSYPEETSKNELTLVSFMFNTVRSNKDKPLQFVAAQFNSCATNISFSTQFIPTLCIPLSQPKGHAHTQQLGMKERCYWSES